MSREPKNTNQVLMASQVFAEGATNSAAFENSFHHGAVFYVDYTAESGTAPTLDVKLQTKNPATGLWHDIPGAEIAQMSAPGTSIFTLYPGVDPVANAKVSDVLPQDFRVVCTVGGSLTPTVTASIACEFVV